MNKAEFVKTIQRNMKKPAPLAIIADILGTFPDALKEAMETDGWVEIDKVCSFEAYDIPARTGEVYVGIKKGEKWTKPAEKWVKINTYPSFKYMFRKEENE